MQKRWSEDLDLTFRLLADPNRHASDAYAVTRDEAAGVQRAAGRAVYVIDRQGTVRYKWVAARPGAVPDVDEVLRAVDALS